MNHGRSASIVLLAIAAIAHAAAQDGSAPPRAIYNFNPAQELRTP
jgi:hypothetical protein